MITIYFGDFSFQ